MTSQLGLPTSVRDDDNRLHAHVAISLLVYWAHTDIEGSCNMKMFLFGFSKQHLAIIPSPMTRHVCISCFSAVDILATGAAHFCSQDK